MQEQKKTVTKEQPGKDSCMDAVFRGKFFQIPRASLPNSVAYRGELST